MNKQDLVAALRAYLDRPGLDDAALAAWIASVEGELNRRLSEHPRMMSLTTITQTAGDNLLTLPSDCLRVLVLRTGQTNWRQLPQMRRDLALRSNNVFIERGNVLELFPAPGQDTVFDLDYYAAIKPLVNVEDTNWVSAYFPDVYLYGCLKEAFFYLRDQQLAPAAADFATRLDALVGQGWNQNTAASPEIY
jgi:hypothetical protein